MTTTKNFDSERVFSSFTDWLKKTTTFVKFKLFQDQSFQNHSAKNLEMYKYSFHASLLKITRFITISKSKGF